LPFELVGIKTISDFSNNFTNDKDLLVINSRILIGNSDSFLSGIVWEKNNFDTS